MKKYLIVIASLFVIASSCKKQGKINYITETETAEALTNKNIDSIINPIGERSYNVVTGTKTVFKYDYAWEDRTPGLADAYTHKIYAFAIDLTATPTAFTLTDLQIRDAIGFYAYFFGYGPSSSALITKGRITGSKINNSTWYVVMHLVFANAVIDLSKNFTIK